MNSINWREVRVASLVGFTLLAFVYTTSGRNAVVTPPDPTPCWSINESVSKYGIDPLDCAPDGRFEFSESVERLNAQAKR